jgi:hypothetical protein
MLFSPKYSRGSVLLRVLGGIVGAFLCFAVLFQLFIEHEFPTGQGRYGYLMLLLGPVFIAYAIGGNKLFNKFYSNNQYPSEQQGK